MEDNSYAGQGPVMLDIGGDIGALIVTMPAAMEGVEVEIRPVGYEAPDHDAHNSVAHDSVAHDHVAHDSVAHDHVAHDHGHSHSHDEHGHSHDHEHGDLIHVAVVGRPLNGRIHYSLVYPELVTGTYELYVRPKGPVQLTASVEGGSVTEAHWPS